jgi:hypothetical protein
MATALRCVVALVAIELCCCSAAKAQIISVKRVGGKTIQCSHTGLSSDLKDCGTQSDWYSYVFVGTISAVAPTKDGEKELQIVPSEIFKGEPANPLIVLTSQCACFPEIKTGDRWLFYLRSGNPIVLDFYGNISSPVADAQQQLDTLRRLKTIGDNGILRGRVKQGPYGQGEAIADAPVIAVRTTDDTQFVASTDADGHYDFQSLPPGRYHLSVASIKSFHADDASIQLKSGQCWELTLSRSFHARLAGHVKRPDGSPADHVPVLIANEDGSGYTTTQSDASGYFHMESMSSGKYVVGIDLPGAPAWKYGSCAGECEVPRAFLYYSDVRNRADALVVNLATDEKRDDIDFTVPAE